MAHQVHDCATTHVMTIRIGRAGLKRLIPAGRDSLPRALAVLSGGANRGHDPYQKPEHVRAFGFVTWARNLGSAHAGA